MSQQPSETLSGSIRAGLSCACPRCGRGKLFRGFLTLRPRCEACGLDYGFADAGDGPAVFIMFLAGFIVVGAALVVEALYHPPYWVHAVLWTPLILIVCLFRALAGQFTPTQHLGFEFCAWYWHFVDVVWLFLFACIYVWGGGAAAG